VERHHLHETARANGAAGTRVQRDVLGEEHANQQGRIDLVLLALGNQRIGDPERQSTILRVPVQELADPESFRRVRRSVDYRSWKSQELARVCVNGLLLRNRPHGATDQQPGECYAMGNRAYSRPEWRGQLWRR
jgi:hypothetical protein